MTKLIQEHESYIVLRDAYCVRERKRKEGISYCVEENE